MIFNMQSGGVIPDRILDVQTITPGTTDQILTAGTYLRGDLTIKGDPDLIAENIKSDIELFGTLGTMKQGLTNVEIGEKTISSNQQLFTITHSLGVVPEMVYIYRTTTYGNSVIRAMSDSLDSICDYDGSLMGSTAELTETEIKFYSPYYGNWIMNHFAAGTYKYVIVA